MLPFDNHEPCIASRPIAENLALLTRLGYDLGIALAQPRLCFHHPRISVRQHPQLLSLAKVIRRA